MSSASFRPGRLFYRTYLGHPARVFGATLKSFFLFHLFWDYFYEFSPTRGASMLPTFEVAGDGVISSKWYRRGRGIAVGDVITFDSVVEPGEKVIKRVIGLEGDYVCMDTPGTGSDAMLQVPQGHCWVVGDNMCDSRDSRLFGPLPMGLIRGKVIAKIFPWSERKWIEDGLQHPAFD